MNENLNILVSSNSNGSQILPTQSNENDSSATGLTINSAGGSRPLASLLNGASSTSSSSIGNSANSIATTTFQQIRVNIKCARFTPSGGLLNAKGDIYVEMIIDGNPSRKTEIAKKTWSPVWNENFDILITPASRIEFRTYNHHSFKSDSLLGQCLIFINKLILETNNPKFTNLEKTFDLVLDHKGKTGCIDVIFNGIDANNLRLNGYFNLTQNKQNGLDTTFPTNETSTLNPSLVLNMPNIASTNDSDNSATTPVYTLNNNNHETEGAVGGGLQAPTTASTANQLLPTTSNVNATADTTSNIPVAQTVQELSIGLARGWEVRLDKKNRPYYIDHINQKTSWKRPEEELPSGWEKRFDSKNRAYFVDHNSKTTTWQKPTVNSVANFQTWQIQREQNQGEQFLNLKHRHLPQTQAKDTTSNSNNPTSNQAVTTVPAVDTNKLPEGWEQRFDISNRPYFVNHKNHTTQWEDPRTQGREVPLLMPDGWEIRFTDKGQRYFVDHNTKQTTFEDPRGKLTYERDFRWKVSKFRYLCQTNTFPGHVKIQVSRTNLFDDSYNQITKLQAFDL
jgi:hypothetical protein